MTSTTAQVSRAEMLPKARLHEMLRRMLRIRLFEERVLAMVYEAQIPNGAHLATGQEAEIVGACMALREDDYMTGNHRSHGHPIGKGAELAPLMAELLGKKTGVCGGKGGSMHLAVFSRGSLGESGIVGSLMPVAVGAGLSATLRGTDQVCLCFFGDGAANCGPFHESLNLASIWKLPVIFLCENNGYAMFTPQAQTTAVTDVAQRGAAYGIPSVVADGQDVLEVYGAVADGVERARSGGGPTLVEAKTYRYCEHSDDYPAGPPLTYRSREELKYWRERDPIEIFSAWLQRSGLLAAAELDLIYATVGREVDAAVQFGVESPPPEPSALFEDL